MVPDTAGFSIANMTCSFFEQPLNHFALPKDSSPKFRQRFCTYDKFRNSSTVFFYTGNESPLEEYVNNTGLMWELGKEVGAQIMFVEHRYEGQSLPPSNISNCMAYSSSVQALADYANFIEKNLYDQPVIAFGGSYGGMLAAWLRMKYPNVVAGAIAASAPIWGFPLNFPHKIDTAFKIIRHGLEQSYPPTEPKQDNNHCATNLLAAQPLIRVLGESTVGRHVLTDAFRLCQPVEDSNALMEWIQSPWFDLAEGSFPYPSSYITYSLLHRVVNLPPWPLQHACWKSSRLAHDLGVQVEGNLSNVHFNVSFGPKKHIAVDWDTVIASTSGLESSPVVYSLLENVRDAVSVWYNVTKDVKCYNLTAAPNTKSRLHIDGLQHKSTSTVRRMRGETDKCLSLMKKTGSWPSLCCNEEMFLIITEAFGLGNDAFWPPMYPRGTKTHADILRANPDVMKYDFCNDTDGTFGFPKVPPDPWATWMDTYYGGTRIRSHSNIIFSNGLLDPWSGAGVVDPSRPIVETTTPGLYVQNITDSMVALIMAYGGHHTDLMYSHPDDPPSITQTRRIETAYIERWIHEWNTKDLCLS